MKLKTKLANRHSSSRFSKMLAQVCALGFFVSFAAVAAEYFSFNFYPLSLSVHFQVFYLFLSVFALVVYVFRRSSLGVLCALLLCGYSLWQVRPYSVFSESSLNKNSETRAILAKKNQLRIVAWNINSSNKDIKPGLAAIKNLNPDIILFLETNIALEKEIFSAFSEYGYRASKPRRDNFGLTFVSKIPLSDAEIKSLGSSTMEMVFAQLEFKEKKLRFYGVHTLPPVSKAAQINQDTQLALLATTVVNQKGPVIVAGDLNTTMWAPNFKRFLKTAKLKDPRLDRGVYASWGTPFGVSLPLDHILPSTDFLVEEISVLANFGSDHAPLVLDLKLDPSQ